MVDRVSSSSFHLQNLRNITDRFSSLNDLNRQISSGLKADSFVDLNGVVEQVSSFESRIARNENFITNNTIISTRLDATNESVSQLQEIAGEFRNLLINTTSQSEAGNLAQDSNATISRILDQLNIEIAGRFIFSGSRTDTQPVANPPTALVPGEVDSSYYQGNSDVLTARISDSAEINYGVPANDEAFQNLIAAVNAGIAAGEAADAGNAVERDRLRGVGIDLINEAITGLGNVRSSVNSNIITVDDAISRVERTNLIFQEALSAETDTDITAATIQLSADETVLQASFAAFSRISSLSLVDFL